MSPRSFAVVTVTLLLVGVLPAVALGGVSGGPETRASESLNEAKTLAPHDSSIEPGEVEMRIELAANGDAQWRVMTAVSVRDEDDREAFDDLVEEFNRSDSPLGLNAFRESARNASRATGREMAIEGVERQHALHNETGALWVTFTWTNFGNGTGDRLAVDDGFNTESGVWLPSLSEEETLVVVPPDGYGVSSAPTGTSSAPSSLANGIARWEGPQEFGQRGPWIVYSGDALVPTPTTAGPGTGTGTSDGPTTGGAGPPGGGGDGLVGGFPLVVLVLVAGASAVVVGLYMRGDDDGLAAVVTDGTDDSGSSAASATDPTTSNTGTKAGSTNGSGTAVDESAANDRAATGSAAAGAGAAGSGAGTDETGETSADDEIDEALLSDEERVERLIERNGGRMKQAAIVRETGWSNAKVSQLLSAMDEEGRIDKLRIGRENLISFPDEDVADLDSE